MRKALFNGLLLYETLTLSHENRWVSLLVFIQSFSNAIHEGYLWKVSTVSRNLTKTTVTPLLQNFSSDSPPFWKKWGTFPQKRLWRVFFRIFSQTHHSLFFGGVGDFPPVFPRQRYQQKHPGSLIKIRKKNDRWGVKPRQSLSKDRYFKAFDSSCLDRGLEWV